MDYKYEPEYFEVDTGRGPVWYKPDFDLPSLKKYLSIKPFKPSEDDITKNVGWTKDIGDIVILFDLNPPNEKTESGYSILTEERSGMVYRQSQTWWAECPRCNHIDQVIYGLPECGCFSEKELEALNDEEESEGPGPYNIFTHSKRLLTAYGIAKKITFPRKDRIPSFNETTFLLIWSPLLSHTSSAAA